MIRYRCISPIYLRFRQTWRESPESKLPVGMQLLGKAFDEATLIRTAYAYERNRGFDLGEPPLK